MSINSIHCSSITEAARLLSSDRQARFLGGGTLVMRAVNDGDQSFNTLLRLSDPAMQKISMTGNRLVLGAGVSMSAILAHRDCAFLAPVARSVGGPAIRNMATVGGNLFAASPYGDFTTALLALDAEVTLAQGNATLALQDFLLNRDAEPRQLVTCISLARPAAADHFRFHKVSRVKPKGIAVMTLAAHLPHAGGTLQNARVAYGAMSATPVRAMAVERTLEGQVLNTATIERAMQVATEGISPPTDALASSWYRQQVAPVHLRRLLTGEQT